MEYENVRVEKWILDEIKKYSAKTQMTYDDQPLEDAVHNILNAERLRLKEIHDNPEHPDHLETK